MVETANILEIVKEDILRILGETKKATSLKFIKSVVKVRGSFLSEAIENLQKKGLIKVRKNISLTKKGQVKAENILRKHLILENYFKKARNKKEADRIAHILEHYISEEVIRNIREISTLKKKGVSLTELKQQNGLITDIVLGIRLFERVVSMGIFPGERIEIIKEIPNGIIVGVGTKKIVLDKNIARKIKVLEYEKS